MTRISRSTIAPQPSGSLWERTIIAGHLMGVNDHKCPRTRRTRGWIDALGYAGVFIVLILFWIGFGS